MTLSSEILVAVAGIITALCTGIVGLVGGTAGFVIAWRNSRAQAKKDITEAERMAVQTKTEDRKADLVIRKDEMDLLRGELSRQYSVIEKTEAKVTALENEAEEWRKKNVASQEAGIALSRQLENARDAIAEQQRRVQEAEEIIKFLVDRERLFRKVMAENNIAIPPMKRDNDERLLVSIEARIGMQDSIDKSATHPNVETLKKIVENGA